jgi:hypothetical protein
MREEQWERELRFTGGMEEICVHSLLKWFMFFVGAIPLAIDAACRLVRCLSARGTTGKRQGERERERGAEIAAPSKRRRRSLLPRLLLHYLHCYSALPPPSAPLFCLQGSPTSLSPRFPPRKLVLLMEATSLSTVDTLYSADAIEFCPGNSRLFACGTYQIEKDESGVVDPAEGEERTSEPVVRRYGRCLLYEIDADGRNL